MNRKKIEFQMSNIIVQIATNDRIFDTIEMFIDFYSNCCNINGTSIQICVE